MINLGFLGFPKYAATKEGRVWSLYSNKYLSDNKYLGDYKAVTLCDEGRRKEFTVHRLVALAFIPNPNDLPQVNHIDGDKHNNHVSNLEWVTAKDNTNHAYELGLRSRTVINEYRILSDQLVHLICKMLDEGARNKDIVSATGVDSTCISSIKAGKFYKDISDEYDFRKIPSSNRYSEDKILSICSLLQDTKLSINAIARKHNVSHGTVRRIKERKTYTYLSNNYDW